VALGGPDGWRAPIAVRSSGAPDEMPRLQASGARAWSRRARRAKSEALHPPRLQAWLCIHSHEGRWDDPDAPDYCGLQMSIEFQRPYDPELLARKGTADNWTPLEQIWVAERAYRSGRGFHPWPSTARYCGLS
jgi:hypothetical protein